MQWISNIVNKTYDFYGLLLIVLINNFNR